MSAIVYRFLGNVLIRGIIRCVHPLHIGGTYEEYEIGGMDNPIIREPDSRYPYIPGSSLRGKMRSMLEWAEGKVELNENGNAPVHTCSGFVRESNPPAFCPVCLAFGSSASEVLGEKRFVGPTRLIIRDAHLTEYWEEKLTMLRQKRGIPMAEYKTENQIDRITSVANPRPIERTIKGTEFELEMVYRIYSIPTPCSLQRIMGDLEPTSDEEEENLISVETIQQCQYDGGIASVEHLRNIFFAMQLVEDTYLGGGGGRGSGKVEFLLEESPDIRKKEDYLVNSDETEIPDSSDEEMDEEDSEDDLIPLSELDVEENYIQPIAQAFGICLLGANQEDEKEG